MDDVGPVSSNSAGTAGKRPCGVVLCSICQQAVVLELAKTDEYGKTIHEECYAVRLSRMRAASRADA